MKRLGLLGGMSWESSVEYERIINRYVRDKLGGVASADLLIRSFNFADIEALQAAGRWDEAGQVLAAAASDLVAGGAEGIVICTNTTLPCHCSRPRRFTRRLQRGSHWKRGSHHTQVRPSRIRRQHEPAKNRGLRTAL